MNTFRFRCTTDYQMNLSGDDCDAIYRQLKQSIRSNKQGPGRSSIQLAFPASVQLVFTVGGYAALEQIAPIDNERSQAVDDSAELHLQDMPARMIMRPAAGQWGLW